MKLSITDQLQQSLEKRREQALYRSLLITDGLVDFCSNDYLSFATSIVPAGEQASRSGSTGSRSISGNTAFAEELEQYLAAFHHAAAGLLFNSGYDANVGLFSSLAKKGDTYITDELIHASIIDGCRLSYATRLRFAHNDITDLERKLQRATGNIFVAVESVYSMDGDQAPLTDIVNLCKQYNASLIVDEAHATGVFGEAGRGLVNQHGLENEVLARVHTFGKAIGCHGAVVVGPVVLRQYLINFARSFIFTTAMPMHTLLSIKRSYEQLQHADFDNNYLHELIRYFRTQFKDTAGCRLLESSSPVQSLVIPGAERVRAVAGRIQQGGYDVRAITPPSVPPGSERLRISLHQHNTQEQVDGLLHLLFQTLNTCDPL